LLSNGGLAGKDSNDGFVTNNGAKVQVISSSSLQSAPEKLVNAFAVLGERLSATISTREIAIAVLETTHKLLSWDAALVCLIHEPPEFATTGIVAYECTGNFLVERQFSYNGPATPFLRRAIECGAFVAEFDEETELNLSRWGSPGLCSRSLMFVPIRNGDVVIAVVSIQSFRENLYTDADLNLFSALTGYCAGALERTFDEQKLRANEARYRQILEHASDAIVLYNQNGVITEVNGKACELAGVGREVLLTLKISDLFSDPASILGSVSEMKSLMGAVRESRLIRSNRSSLYVELTTSQISDNEYHLIFRDTSKQHMAMRQRDLIAHFSKELAGANSLRQVSEIICALTEALWKWDAYLFSVIRSGQERFQTILAVDTVDGEKRQMGGSRSGSSRTDFQSILRQGKPVLYNRSPQDAGPKLNAFGDCSRRSESLMFAPISIAGHVIGIVSIQSYINGFFADTDLGILEKIAALAGPALERCRAEMLIRVFSSLGNRLNVAKAPVEAAEVIIDAADELIGCDRGIVDLYSPGSVMMQNVLLLDMSNGRKIEDSQQNLSPRIPDEMARNVFENGAQLLLHEHAARGSAKKPLLKDTCRSPASLMFVPIRVANETIGILSLQSYTYRAYDERDLATLQSLADFCGGALQRTSAQLALSQSERKYRLLIENVNDGIVITQSERIVYVNDRFAQMLGYSAEELQNADYRVLYDAGGLELLMNRQSSRRDGEEVPARYENRMRRKDASNIDVDVNVAIIENFTDEPASFGVVRDVSERKAQEKRIRESEAELRALFAAMTDVIMVIDADGCYQKIAPTNPILLFRPADQLLGKRLCDVFDQARAEEFLSYVRQALVQNKSVQANYAMQIEGRTIWFDATITPMLSDCVLWVARDVTATKTAEEESFRSNAKYETLINASDDYIFVMDRDMRYVQVNNTVERRYGIKRQDRVGKTLYDLLPADRAAFYADFVMRVFETGQAVRYDDSGIINGRFLSTETVLSPILGQQSEVEAVVGVSRENTDRRRAEAALTESEQRYALATRATNDGIWDWDVHRNEIYYSARWIEMLGLDRNSITRHPDEWFGRVHTEDLKNLRNDIDAHLEGKTPHFESEYRIMHANGDYRWMLVRGVCVRDEIGTPYRVAGSQSDINTRKNAEEELLHGAFHDALTGLPNRAFFSECLVQSIARARRRDNYCFAVLFLDLDRFKIINDSLGHIAGDELLITVSRRLELCLRPGDAVARLGGDEFTILLEDISDVNDATRVAERIQEKVSEPIVLGMNEVFTTVSIGIALSTSGYSAPDEVIRDADTAMYRAKAKGKARHEIFDKEMHARAVALLQLESDLRRAQERNELKLDFQPIVELQNESVVGFESLLRWHHFQRGSIAPAEFIPLAEETGLIVPIGTWVLKEAVQQLMSWRSENPHFSKVSISVNLSGKQFARQELMEQIEEFLSNLSLDAGSLALEITESEAMEHAEAMINILNRLKNLRVGLHIDDFGTGYSSLSYLHRFPIDVLKIDRSFISRISENGREGMDIVQGIVMLAHSLKVKVIAEGIESEMQYRFLRETGCDFGQGYYFSKPVSADKARLYFESKNSKWTN
jgi:diguanylate cyclase (GGDEF)-like protein/PAS domain S-box-containing protein